VIFSPVKQHGLLVLAALCLATPAFPQSQPPSAINQQDEVVNVNLLPTEGADKVLEILRSGDKLEINDYQTRAFELKNTLAYEMRIHIQEAVAREKGIVRAVRTRPADPAQARHFLVVTTTAEQLPSIEETIRALDIPGFVSSQGRSRRAIRLKHRLASEVAVILRSTRLSSVGTVFPDDSTNTIYYDDTEYVAKAIEPYVAYYDVPSPQVEFDVQITEVREEDSAKVGLDWDAWKQSVGGQFAFTANNFEGGDSFARLDTLLTLDANVLANFLNYTIQKGNARLLQRSRLNATNLEPAVISDARRVGAFDYQRTTSDGGVVTEINPRVNAAGELDRDESVALSLRPVTINPRVNQQLRELGLGDEGLQIVLLPQIGTESVTADIDITLNTVTGFDQLGRPIISRQELTNLFTLQDGKQLLLGTLERETATKTRRGIPGLMEVPVLKYLFSVEATRNSRSRLFLIATPKFSNISFGAREIKELDKAPALQGEERAVQLEDAFWPEPLSTE
jgi:type II secretory pathway component GspD/PulD (secretin)